MTKLILIHKAKKVFAQYGKNFTANSKCSFEYGSSLPKLNGYISKSGVKVKYGNMYCALFALGIIKD